MATPDTRVLTQGQILTRQAVSSVMSEWRGTPVSPTEHSDKGGFLSPKIVGILAVPFLIAACGGGDKTPTTPTTLPTDTPRPTSTFEPTATPSATLVESPSTSASATTAEKTPAPTTTPAEKTPAPTVKPLESVTNPAPSEKPQSPVTAQQMEAAVTAYVTANPDGDLLQSQIDFFKGDFMKQCEGKAGLEPGVRQGVCERNILGFLTSAQKYNDQLAYQAGFETYWYTVGSNGMGPSVKASIDSYLALDLK